MGNGDLNLVIQYPLVSLFNPPEADRRHLFPIQSPSYPISIHPQAPYFDKDGDNVILITNVEIKCVNCASGVVEITLIPLDRFK